MGFPNDNVEALDQRHRRAHAVKDGRRGEIVDMVFAPFPPELHHLTSSKTADHRSLRDGGQHDEAALRQQAPDMVMARPSAGAGPRILERCSANMDVGRACGA